MGSLLDFGVVIISVSFSLNVFSVDLGTDTVMDDL